eukprot:m51a1_g9955 hypothetical protein (289) ;mRNA; r:46319-47234
MERTLGILLEETPEFGEHLEMHMIGEPLDDPHVSGWSISTHQQSIDAVPIVGALLKVLLSPTRSLGPVLLTPLTIDLATHAQVVWNSEGDIVSVTGTTVPDAHQRAHLQGRAVVGKEEAVAIAQHEAGAEDGRAKCAEAREVVLRPGMANGEPGPNVRAWEVQCGTSDVYIDMRSREVVSVHRHEVDVVSRVYEEASHELLWQEGSPLPADTDIVSIVNGIAHAERVWKEFSGLDCYDNKGSPITAYVHMNRANAFYSNRTMHFGTNFVSLSIMWHEYAHGITEFLDG